jgi:hypothetical protein
VLKEVRKKKTVCGRNCYITWIVVEDDFLNVGQLIPTTSFKNTSPDGPNCENDASDEHTEEENIQEMHSLFIATSSQMC